MSHMTEPEQVLIYLILSWVRAMAIQYLDRETSWHTLLDSSLAGVIHQLAVPNAGPASLLPPRCSIRWFSFKIN